MNFVIGEEQACSCDVGKVRILGTANGVRVRIAHLVVLMLRVGY